MINTIHESLSGLAPDHIADLHKSRLSDDTIYECQFKAVPPNKLRILRGIESAYEIPYFNLDNSRNGFSRWKLFYEAGFTGDRKKKYHQQTDSGVEVYLPPLVKWSDLAADPTQPIGITEGEKKAIALTQLGSPTMGLGGVWNHHDHLADGVSFVVPTLTQLSLKNRRVELIPDSDAWRKDKWLNVLGGLYVLGMWLARQGAHVVFVKIPEAPGSEKVGADDFLVHYPDTGREEWAALKRIPITNRGFDALSSWHQRRETHRQAHDAIREGATNKLTVNELAGSYTVQSPTHRAAITFERFHMRGGSLIAEVEVTVEGLILRSGIDLSLKTETAQATLAKNLTACTEQVPWKWFVPQACALVLSRYREGEPITRIDKDSVGEPLTYVLNPLIVKRKPTVVFCDGGQGKSTFALACAMGVSTGASFAGFRALKGSPLYLDYEDDHNVHIRRLHALRAGHPELDDSVVHHHKPTDRLARCIPEITRKIRECQATFLIIDSLLMAAGGASDAEATEAFFMALRRFDLESLVIAHTPKTLAENQDRPTIYGSVFNSNLARNTFELVATPGADLVTSYLTLHHRKSNFSRLLDPISLQVTRHHDGSFIRYEVADPAQTPELTSSLPIWAQIRNLLEDGTPRTSGEVADALGLPLKQARAHLSKYVKQHKWMACPGADGEQRYTVLTPRREGVP